MVGFFNKNKKKQNVIGYKHYRVPSVFVDSKNANPKKTITFPKISIKVLFWFGLIVVSLYYVFLTPRFLIKDVIVEGNNLLNSDEINAEIPTGYNILLINTSKLSEKMLKQFPEISNVQIFRGLPDTVKIVVVEKEPKLVWQSGDKKYLICSQGDVCREVRGAEGEGLPLVVDKKSIPVMVNTDLVSSSFVAFVLNVSENFSGVVNIKPISFEITDTTFDINLVTDAGFHVKMNTMRSSKKQIDSLKTILIEKRPDIHEYVDLRIDGWAYYK